MHRPTGDRIRHACGGRYATRATYTHSSRLPVHSGHRGSTHLLPHRHKDMLRLQLQLRRLFLLCTYLLSLVSLVGGDFHRGFPPPKPVACCCYSSTRRVKIIACVQCDKADDGNETTTPGRNQKKIKKIMLLATRTLSHLRARSHPTHTHAPPLPNPNHPALVNRPPTNSLAGIVHEGVSGRDRQVGRRVLWVRGQRRQFLLALRDLRGPGLRLHVRRRRRERRRWRVHWPTSVCTISEPRAASHQLHCARLFYLLFSGISSLLCLRAL